MRDLTFVSKPGAQCGSPARWDLCGGRAEPAKRRPVPTATEINETGVPTPLNRSEGNIAGGAMREPSADPARSENLCMYGISMRENREIPRSPVRLMTGRAAQGTPRR